MSARLRGIARQTEPIVAAGAYTAPDGREVSIAAAVEAARDGTRMHGPDPVPVPRDCVPDPFFEVTGESGLEAARRLGDGAAVLDFASASLTARPTARSAPRSYGRSRRVRSSRSVRAAGS